MLYNKINFHIHTYHSKCADKDMTPQNIIKILEKKGYVKIGFSDHVSSNKDIKEIIKLKEEILDLNSNNMEIYLGCEIDNTEFSDRTSVGEEIRKYVDFVILSFTHYQSYHVLDGPKSLDKGDVIENVLKKFRYACSFNFVDIIAHPFHCFGLSRYLPEGLMNWEGKNIDISYLVPMILEREETKDILKMAKKK